MRVSVEIEVDVDSTNEEIENLRHEIIGDAVRLMFDQEDLVKISPVESDAVIPPRKQEFYCTLAYDTTLYAEGVCIYARSPSEVISEAKRLFVDGKNELHARIDPVCSCKTNWRIVEAVSESGHIVCQGEPLE